MSDDEEFRLMLREMNSTFGKWTVTGEQIEEFINEYANKDFSKLFEQYLRTKKVPILEFTSNNENIVQYRWSNCVADFDMPVLIHLQEEKIWLYPTKEWQEFETELDLNLDISVSPDFYINTLKK